MAPDAGGKPLGAIARAFSAMRGTMYRPPATTIAGLNTSGWPTALQPVQPVGPKGSQPLAFSYYFGINQQITPRFDDILSAGALRELASYPLARICIENVKDVLCSMSWKIQLRRVAGQPISEWKKANASDKNIRTLTEAMEMPDGETPWPDWWRPVLEDMLVIDGASILTESYLTGQVACFRWTDGADILRLIDDRGYTPAFPSPAYTQLWEGIPRLLLNTGQLIYRPSNIVAGTNYSSKLYGTSITQQLAPEIRIGQERLRYVLAFYTEGGVPGLAQVVPPGISPDRIQEAQAWMNSEMSGQLAKRRGWRLVQGFVDPSTGGSAKDQILELKDPILADVFDDLHIRKMCYGYGNSAQRLLKQMNRASAEAGQDAAEKEGVVPRLKWMKGTADTMLRRRGAGAYEVIFDTDDELDAGKQAEVSKTLISIGRLTIDEDREDRGLVPFGLPETSEPIIILPTGVQPLEGSFDRTQQQLDNDTTQAEKPAPTPVAAPKPAASASAGKRGGARKKSQRPAITAADPILIDTDKLAPTTNRYIGFMTQRLSHFFRQAAKRIGAGWIQEHGSDMTLKSANDDGEDEPSNDPDLERELLLFGARLTPIQRNSVRAMVLLGLANMKWETLPQRLQGYYSRSSSAGQGIGLDQISGSVPDNADIPTRAELEEASSDEISEFVAMRTAELVGMRRAADGSLVENPDARWAISDLTRSDLVKTVCQAIEEGWTASQLAAVIEAAYSFSSARSAVIARSELARSQAFGNYIVWNLTGLAVFVRWVTSGEENVCPICIGFEAQGIVPLGHEFAPGIEYPTAHPFCNCALEVVSQEEKDAES